MRARLAAACGLLPLWCVAVSCSDGNSIVVVNVDSDPGVAAVVRLQATLSNGGLADEKTFPAKGAATATALTFPTAFSLTIPGSRSGALDLALDGLDAGGAVVANGDGSVGLSPGNTVTVTITLHAGASLCGNGQLDAGEACDDGDRFSSGTCDFRCQPRGPGPGTGGAGGRGGAGGSGGAGGGPCTVELLTNGTFEGGDSGWTSVTSGRALIYNWPDVDPALAPMPDSPDYLAWLGYDVVSETVTLRQQIQIPSDALSLTASGYVQIWTDDDPSVMYDVAYADILVGGFAQSIGEWSNVDFDTSWSFFTQDIDATAVAGATATFQLRVQMDDGANTSFFFDTLSVVANRCPP